MRPSLPAVKYGDQFEAVAAYAVRDDVRCSGDDEFPGAGNSAYPPDLRVRLKKFDSA